MCKVSSSTEFVTRSLTVGREGAAHAQWVPNTDVYTNDAGLVVKLELAGMRSENLEITVAGHQLRIRGERPDGCRAGKCNFLMMAIDYGPFETALELPPGYDLGAAKAVYLNGFLRIDVPVVRQPDQPARVPITDGAE